MLFEKLLLHNARLDSLEVTDAEVLGEIDRRLTYYMQMFGSVEAFEAEYGKSVAEWKAEFNEPVREQILAQKMQAEIDQSVRSTPAQVQDYFDAIPTDSLPLIPEELSYSELVMQPEVGEKQKMRTRNTLDSIRILVETGKMSMTLAATRYSEDPGSKYKGGCYQNIGRGQFVPEFEGAVYETEVGGYSPVFESDFGYHFLRVTDRRGEQYSACHVLMKPTFDPKALEQMQAGIDSVSVKLALGDLPFETAVLNTAPAKKRVTKRAKSSTRRRGHAVWGGRTRSQHLFPLARLGRRWCFRPRAASRRGQSSLLGHDSAQRALPRPPRQSDRRLRPVSATSRSRAARRGPFQVDWPAH